MHPSSNYQQHQAQQAAINAAQQQQHHGRIQGNPNMGASMAGHLQETGVETLTEDNRRTMGFVADLLNDATREAALLELSKKREQVPELAMILWHSFGTLPRLEPYQPNESANQSPLGVMTSLMQEIISVYNLLNPSQLTAAASNRVCNALALLQCVASHNDTRTLFLNGNAPRSPTPYARERAREKRC